MPPYDPRDQDNGGGAGVRRHRAVLLGVDSYQQLSPVVPVARSLQLMTQALTAEHTGVFDPGDLVVLEGQQLGQGEFRSALSTARDQAEGLLLVYFAGHGRVRSNGTDLHLMVSGSRVTNNREHPFVDAISWQRDVMGSLIHAKADWVVVVLDCCYAGNALRDFTPEGEQNFAVLTAAEDGVEIPGGSHADGTPFTRELHRLLTKGIPGRPHVTFTGLVTAVREAMAPIRAVDEHRWLPDERRHGDDVVLSHASPPSLAPPVPMPPPPAPALPAPTSDPVPATAPPAQTSDPVPDQPDPPSLPARAVRRVRRWVKSRPLTRTAALILTPFLLATAGGIYALNLGDAAACAPPMELRLLTDPDAMPTIQKAADAYVRKGLADCRTIGITVYQAKATDAVTAFRKSAAWQSPSANCPSTGDCLRPQRDLGAQPDIWIPGASSTWQRARTAGKQVVTLDRLGSVAYTPLVLAVPDTVPAPAADQTGAPLRQIIDHIRTPQSRAVLLRPDPEYTDAALLGTVALYNSLSGDPDQSQTEQDMVRLLPPAPSTAHDLMCTLALGVNSDLDDRAVVLIPEQTMALFNLAAADPGHPACASATLSKRIAHYPTDVAWADLPFIHVTWQGADQHPTQRDRAVQDFYTWLTGPVAQNLFTGDGYRGMTEGRPAKPRAGSLLTRPANSRAVHTNVLPADTSDVHTTALDDTLRHYRQALGPGRILYLLDSSSSMHDVWSGQGRARDLLARSLGSVGAGDDYALWSVADDGKDHYHELLDFGTHDRKSAEEEVKAATMRDQNADIAGALRAALDTMRDQARKFGDRPQLIVLITDNEDSKSLTPAALKSLERDAKSGVRSRVVTVSLRGGGCDAVPLNQRITAATGGRCLEQSDGLAAELAAEVAKTGTGDAE